jgi:hypothetical protein
LADCDAGLKAARKTWYRIEDEFTGYGMKP